jgi:hypothetical protein
MKVTGVYHEILATDLHDTGFCVSLVNPHRCREIVRGMEITIEKNKVDAGWPVTHF